MTKDDRTLGVYYGIHWCESDARCAELEGWDLFENDQYGPEIERDDEFGLFASDHHAVDYVARRARSGSLTHRKALLITAISWYYT